jgi:sterol desaturase/sphingolipid hydroxylase (fatty acid hydroxylase superfamily)
VALAPDQIAVMTMPLFLSGMAAEEIVARWRHRSVYGMRQTLNNLSVAFGSRAILAATGLVPLLGYDAIRSVSPLAGVWTNGVATWIVGFFAMDLAFYVRHRLAHRVALLWCVHAVHHQSREYNLSVATRLGWFQDAIVIAWPLAALGLPLHVAFTWWLAGNSY